VGGGTVRTAAAVAAIRDAGGAMVIMPHVDPALIRASKEAGMVCIPGVATPTEAFNALDAGADALKLFPAEPMGASTLQAWRAIIPESVPILPVGGIVPDHLASYINAGASGFGLGSALYRPGMTPEEVRIQATRFVFAVATARATYAAAHSRPSALASAGTHAKEDMENGGGQTR
jgi:2-dehydro-3-deoxyphosphogalactonate aldolase